MEPTPDPEPTTEEETPEEPQEQETELDDFEDRKANMMSHYHINIVTTCTTRVVEGVPQECLIGCSRE